METALALQLIARYGIPLAYQIWDIVKNKNEMTDAEWDALLVLASKTTDEYVAEAKALLEARKGLNVTSNTSPR